MARGAVSEEVDTSDLPLASGGLLQGGSCAYTSDDAPELIENAAQLFSFLPDPQTYPSLHALRDSGGGAFLFEGLEDAGADCVLYFCNDGGETVYRNSRLVMQGPLSRIGPGGKAMEDALANVHTTGRRCVSLFASGVSLRNLAGKPDEDVSKEYEPLLNHMAHVDSFSKEDPDKWRVILTLYADPDPVVSVNTEWQQKFIDAEKEKGKFLFFFRPRARGRDAKQYRVPCPPFSIMFLHSSMRDGNNGFKHGVTVVAPEGRKQYIVASCIANVMLTGSAEARFAKAKGVADKIYAKMDARCAEILARDDVELGKDGKMAEIPWFDALSFAGRGSYWGARPAPGRGDEEDTDELTQAMKDLEAWKEANDFLECQVEGCHRHVKTNRARGLGQGHWCGFHSSNESRGLQKQLRGRAAGAPQCKFAGCNRAVQKVWYPLLDRHLRAPQGWCSDHASRKGRGEKFSAVEKTALKVLEDQPDLRCSFVDPLKEHYRVDDLTGEWGPARCLKAKKPRNDRRGKVTYTMFCNRHVNVKEQVPGSCPAIGEPAPEWVKNKLLKICGGKTSRARQDELHPRGWTASAAAAGTSAGAAGGGGASASGSKRPRNILDWFGKEPKGKEPAV